MLLVVDLSLAFVFAEILFCRFLIGGRGVLCAGKRTKIDMPPTNSYKRGDVFYI